MQQTPSRVILSTAGQKSPPFSRSFLDWDLTTQIFTNRMYEAGSYVFQLSTFYRCMRDSFPSLIPLLPISGSQKLQLRDDLSLFWQKSKRHSTGCLSANCMCRYCDNWVSSTSASGQSMAFLSQNNATRILKFFSPLSPEAAGDLYLILK